MSKKNGSDIVQNYARGFLLLYHESDKSTKQHKIQEYDRYSLVAGRHDYADDAVNFESLDFKVMVVGFTAHISGEYMVHLWCADNKSFMRAQCQSFFKRLNADDKRMYALTPGNEDDLRSVDLKGYFRSSEKALTDESQFFRKALTSRNEYIANKREAELQREKEQQEADDAFAESEHARKKFEKSQKAKAARAAKRKANEKLAVNIAEMNGQYPPIVDEVVNEVAEAPKAVAMREQLKLQKKELEQKQRLIVQHQEQLQQSQQLHLSLQQPTVPTTSPIIAAAAERMARSSARANITTTARSRT
jgi:pyruvate/2-oxoglutarate dehydrogenase complex dihydrolipoamide acyltransferase (E2) component